MSIRVFFFHFFSFFFSHKVYVYPGSSTLLTYLLKLTYLGIPVPYAEKKNDSKAGSGFRIPDDIPGYMGGRDAWKH